MKKGIDVSYAQGKIDWAKVKKAGIEFAIIRAGFGNSISQKDKYFEANIKEALAVGIDVGAYWFSYATSVEDAKKEAAVFKEVLAPYKDKITYPVCIDYEYDSIRYSQDHGVNPTNKLITDMMIAFMEAMKGYGYKVAYYTNLDFIRTRLENDRLKAYDLWLAHYTDGKPAYDCAIQQNSSTGRISGINGDVDTDIAIKDFAPKTDTQGDKNNNVPPVICTGNSVRIRKDAHTIADVIGFSNKGDALTLLADDGWGWSKVKVKGLTGWMSNEYIGGAKRSGYKTGTCNGQHVNVRAAANLNGNILTQMNKGDKFTLICIYPSKWLHVRFGGGEGYVFYDKGYISI